MRKGGREGGRKGGERERGGGFTRTINVRVHEKTHAMTSHVNQHT